MKLHNKWLISLLTLFPLSLFAQDKSLFAQLMDTSDKMFVVVIVLLIIFLGIIFFLTLLDKKITKLEKEIEK